MRQTKLKLAFAGTPEIARIVLESLIDADQHDVEMIFTKPDKPAGRGNKIRQSEVKICALKNNIKILQPKNYQELESYSLENYDLLLVVAYGLLLTPTILAKPKFGCINIHTSLLPRWRGAAPIQRAIEAGDIKTGVTIMQMDKNLDTGKILKQISCSIKKEDTRGILHDRYGKKVQIRTLGMRGGWLRKRLGFNTDALNSTHYMHQEGANIVSTIISEIESKALWGRFGL